MSRRGATKFGQIHSAKNPRRFLSAMDLMIIRGCCWNMDLLPRTTLTAVFMSHQVGFIDFVGIERHNNKELCQFSRSGKGFVTFQIPQKSFRSKKSQITTKPPKIPTQKTINAKNSKPQKTQI